MVYFVPGTAVVICMYVTNYMRTAVSGDEVPFCAHNQQKGTSIPILAWFMHPALKKWGSETRSGRRTATSLHAAIFLLSCNAQVPSL